MVENETIIINKFILGKGESGIYSDLKILVKKTNNSNIKRGKNIENKNEELLNEIESQLFNNWIKAYEKDGVHLEIVILNVGIDNEGRKYAIENSVNGAMHMALPKIGIVPPQIFGL